MDLFTQIKMGFSVKEAAEYYGLEVNRGNMVCCPFHNDRTPSMKLNEEYFYCFGCGAAGDVINFVRKISNLGYVEAVKQLAGRAGMPMPEEDDQESRSRSRLLEINRNAARYFYDQLNAPTPEAAMALSLIHI